MRKQRVVNKRLLRKVGGQACCVCFLPGPSDPCHIKSKGSGGPDRDWNLVPMCRRHHSEQHSMGILTFFNKQPFFRAALRMRGWFLLNGDLWNDKIDPAKDDEFDPEVEKEGDA